MTKYDIIFEALQERVNSGELTLEDAEILNDAACEKYVVEDGHSKKLKARHNAHKKHNEQRFYDNMGFKYSHTDDDGTKHGTVQRGNGPETKIKIPKKGNEAYLSNMDGDITISRNLTRINGSDLVGSHEYSHSIDHENIEDKIKKDRDEYAEKDKKIVDNYLSSNQSAKSAYRQRKKIINKYLDKYNKTIEDGDEQFKDLAKTTKKTLKIKDPHDSQTHELKADNYALTTTRGNNNPNRYRKTLNDISRRALDSDARGGYISLKKLDKVIDDAPEKTATERFIKKRMESFAKKRKKTFSSIIKKDVDRYKKKTSVRKDAAEYILNNNSKK